ncbi:hypothetical protein SUGI_0082060 [Cryptomeria japonica]|uniref:cationic amino acid transporter 5 n=1 Tax=Cryptomeria japonica TaxID=3369 RepID=UPI00240892D2|nr:cationic amino acid transporter 5 [Cryptomeria japonica]GLJ08144.1 hypothetical protein SUGI_0082060 [Cryptomeria japonica]
MSKGEVKSEIVSLLDGGLTEGIDAVDGVKSAGKKYFLPGESFKSWTNYGKALWQTPQRFKDRALSRADEMKEVGDIRKRSENEMRRTLNWWDLTWFGFGAVIGTGIFVLTGQEAHKDAGPAIVLSYALSGFSIMLSVFCFTEFAVEIPVAGGPFAYFRVELGDLAAFIAAGNIILELVVGGAMVARSWTSYFATLLNHSPDDFRIHTNLPSDFNLLDPIAVVVTLLASLTAIVSTRLTSQLNWISTALNTIIILFIIIAGFIKGNLSNLTPFLPYGVKGVLRATAVVYFAYGGFDVIATVAEETKNPSRDIPLGLLGSMSGITVIYCLMALALVLMQSYIDLDVNAAYSLAFQSIGWKWAKYVVALGSLKGITTVLMMGAVKRGRYLMHIARTHMIPPWFGLVSEKTGTPINGTAFMAIASASVAFFSRLDVLSNLRAISSLFIYALLSVALLVRRHYLRGKTSASRAFLLTTFIVVIICSSIGTSVYWALSSGLIGYYITVPVWFLATAGLALFVPQSREAKLWGVPMVPWVPSLSIFINVFLMGSLDYESFVRFGVCTIVMLVYYAFFGLHASFDAFHSVGDT